MSGSRKAIILAAGKSTRMKSHKSKVLHELGGRPLLGWVAALARDCGVDEQIAVVGADADDVRSFASNEGLKLAVQDPPEGTGHAVLCAKDALSDMSGTSVVLYGDTPLIRSETLARVFEALESSDLVVIGFRAEDPGAYGRLVTDGDGALTAIVEAKEADAETLAINLCNSGVMAASTELLFSLLDDVTNDNAKGEYYLTDCVHIARSRGLDCRVVECDEAEVLGVNSRADLAAAEAAFQTRARRAAMERGATLRDPATTYFSYDTVLEQDAEIGPQVIFGPGVTVRRHGIIHGFCHIEGAHIGSGAQIGPFARLRPGTDMGNGSKAGNFVEIKKANIGHGAKVNHLSYIGDADVGAKANIGAGTITCNYDGYDKHRTVIGDEAFIGSNSSLVAPVEIGKGAYTGSGGVITQNVPDEALALARAEQVNKEGWAARYKSAKEKRKEKKS